MKNRIMIGLILTAVTVLGDLGLFSVFLDSSFRGDYPTIQVISFSMVFLFPLVMIGLFFSGSIKANSWSAIGVITIVFIYLVVKYGIRLLTEFDLAVFTTGYLVAMSLSIIVLLKSQRVNI